MKTEAKIEENLENNLTILRKNYIIGLKIRSDIVQHAVNGSIAIDNAIMWKTDTRRH